MLKLLIKICLILPLLAACSQSNRMVDLNSLKSALKQATPGDTIYIKEGVYRDIQLQLEGHGTAERPIVVMAQKPGEVFVEGASNLHLCGEYVEINGLYFRNGHTPKGGVIEFRNGEQAASNCRITACVIAYFNPENRAASGSWILLYGQNNRLDHNSILGKLYTGVTVAVILNSEQDRENHHSIDHNYFGERPILGSNGGETIRVGTSHHAFFSSNTVIEDNMFHRCDGEVEVVSIKSSDNVIRNNVFLACRGILALRHGNRNLVEGNAFIGNNLPNTGGVRIVNEGHTIKNNLFHSLKGDRFFAALGLMNAVPHSLPNRYHHVKNITFEDNRFIDCAHILFCVGKDNERTLPPSTISFCRNQFVSSTGNELYQTFDDISGFTFADNKVNYLLPIHKKGFTDDKTLSADIDLRPFTEKETGAAWYVPTESHTLALSGREIKVKAGQNTLPETLSQAKRGDILTLSEEGIYWIDSTLQIDKYIRIQADTQLVKRPVLCFNGSSGAAFITLVNGGNLEIQGIAFNGEGAVGKALADGGITVKSGTITPYLLTVDNCEFYNFNESGLAAIRGEKSTFSPKVVIRNSFFHDMSGEAVNFAGEKEDKGIYNVEELTVDNCAFYRLLGSALNVYRGGNDESTSGPSVKINHCTIENVDNKEQGSAMRLIGVQQAAVTNCSFANSGRGGASIRFNEMSWDKLSVSNINLHNSGRIASFWDKLNNKNRTNYKPEYIDMDAANFYQAPTSPLKHKALDGKDLGIIE